MRKELRRIATVAAVAVLSASSLMAQTFTIGANNGSNTTTGYPCPLQDYYKTQRAQYLYRASELTAAGMVAGDITQLTWTVTAPYDITDLDGGVIEGYTLKMKHTALTTLSTTGWEAGATTVWGPTNYIPVNGANTFTLTTAFTWDGVSNVIVEVCGGLSTGEWEENAQVIYTSGLGFNGSRTYRSDTELSVCTYTGTSVAGTATSRPQIIFAAAAAPDCTGTPVVSGASSTAASVCADELFTVSVDPVEGVGITYQWASSPDGGTWTDIVGATSASYEATQTEATYYACTVTCTASGESATSTSVMVGQNAGAECYCEPTYTTGTGFGDYIQNVTLGTINNTTGAGAAPYYAYYAGISTDAEVGATYTIDITVGTYTWNDVAAWIDYNMDGNFDDLTEKLGEVDDVVANGVGSITFTVPGDASVGMTRLRVREADQALDIESCETLTYGETEDYDINITSVPVDCEEATGLYADGITSTTADLHWDAVGAASNWHVTVARTSDKVIVAKIQAATNSATVTGLTPGTDYGFQVRSFCVADGITSSMSDKYYFGTPLREGEIATSANIYPNPNSGVFTLALNGYEGNTFTLNVLNTLGQVVYTQVIDVTVNAFTQVITLDQPTAGMYQINLNNDIENINYSIVVTE